MAVLILILNGILIGIANVIPGVSGGTMAVSLGIYDKMIGSITKLRKQWKKSLAFLVPILLGAAIGVVAFSRAMEYLLEEQPLPTSLAFIGLILGGFPMLYASMKKAKEEKAQKGFSVWNILAFLTFLAIAVGLPLLKGNDAVDATISVSFINAVKMLFLGILAAGTMVIPGVSGSMVLMILGYYYGVLNAVNNMVDALTAFDISRMLECCALLVPFGIGVLIGIGGIAKLIDYLLKKHAVTTYAAVFGLILASPFGILYNTKVFSSSPSTPAIVIGIVLLIVCAGFTYLFAKKTNKVEKTNGQDETV